MEKIDRLTSLLNRFRLTVRPCAPSVANLVVFEQADEALELVFQASAPGIDGVGAVLSLAVDVEGGANPLLTALPVCLRMDAGADPEIANLIRLILSELRAGRCGSPAVLDRLVEILVVRVLRVQLQSGQTTPGLLGGLAHPRVARALVAIHEDPERAWRNADLAAEAGLSLSRFKELFQATVGETPASYLRRWRMTLARRELERGERVDRVARRFGYTAPDAFSRAYLRQFGTRPKQAGLQAAQ
ncbi:MAG: helix-turn-helix domain-containing protein [Rhodobacteraceae bacterium]|nr:helix-turn-helix domain-containing protein [Paracoccaceae bacterium]